MSDVSPHHALHVARLAAAAGGEIVRRYFRDGVEIRSKNPYDLVSDADVESEQAAAAAILSAFPDHTIVGEETYRGDPAAPHAWVIDPLDGTNNFAHGLPRFAVSIAYCESGVPKAGVVYNPISEDWYVAVADGGAFHNDRTAAVTDKKKLDEVLIGVGFYYDRGAMMEATLSAIRALFAAHIHGIRRFGAASLDLCSVGVGQYGAFFEYELSPWDFAAGALFVAEAGGLITTCRGEKLPLARNSVLAGGPDIHAAVLEIVRGLHP